MTMSDIKTFAVIGAGEFGRVAAEQLAPPNSTVLGFDSDPDAIFSPQVKPATLEECAQADVVVLAVPFEASKTVVPKLARILAQDTLVVDVCSVKLLPTELFAEAGLLDRENILMTHPLFGPQSIEHGIVGKTVVITEQKGERAQALVSSWQEKGSTMMYMSAEDHDREMAKVHALTFLVGRTLLTMGIGQSDLRTKYFSELMDLVEIERHHSQELFETIQKHNPFARQMREDFIRTAQQLHEEMSEVSPSTLVAE